MWPENLRLATSISSRAKCRIAGCAPTGCVTLYSAGYSRARTDPSRKLPRCVIGHSSAQGLVLVSSDRLDIFNNRKNTLSNRVNDHDDMGCKRSRSTPFELAVGFGIYISICLQPSSPPSQFMFPAHRSAASNRLRKQTNLSFQ